MEETSGSGEETEYKEVTVTLDNRAEFYVTTDEKMKRAIKILSIMVMTVILLTITVAPALATGFNFEDAISEFYSDGTNTFELAIEKTHKPGAALWTEGGMATCYSSNESVVTVSEKGLVTAIGEGTAYVAIDAGSMYKLSFILPFLNF